jgi:asparagine N-glycosylation enzyme membrane subunit Stt3
MRPVSIRRFDFAYLGSLAFSVVDFVLERDALTSRLAAQSGESGIALSGGMVTWVFTGWMVFLLVLWFLAARKRATIAKWIIVLLVAIGLYAVPTLFSGAFTLAKTVSAMSLVLSLLAVYYLFQPDAKAWFAGQEPIEPDQPAEG